MTDLSLASAVASYAPGVYPVNELFETIQGEGIYTGQPSIFLRLQGCPVGCPWCDTQHTWALEQSDAAPYGEVIAKTEPSPRFVVLNAAQILAKFHERGFTAKHVVITGGEPCMYDLNPLAEVLEAAGYQLQIETSGTFPIQTSAKTWVTVSPKLDMPGGLHVLPEAMARANEIKHPIAMEKHIEALDALLARCPVAEHTVIALQPISQRPRATELAIKTCIERNWRLSVQMHKYLAIE
ncbi:7-carboxy-7-deazaguanine synthase QueE [Aliidiomarina halalkaliphila]|uniref:7-carboxy-7-deazaguanine synthase n=1 Tax=Aliidiomarina halalkaliphila TaxID=2593535 RepID=A0A552X4E8_9GAMM|nr:7-carboxy-7-deazaguanine synthase QueE [Aliidiomarina halalkaliphila]TRW49473.1 7-carboxy-7-deazaguanine synthase QueE [Aliidiomarina halalkaliphila]